MKKLLLMGCLAIVFCGSGLMVRTAAGEAGQPQVANMGTKPGKLPAPYFKKLSNNEYPPIKSLANRQCFETEFGWIFCNSEEDARQMSEDTRAGAAAFLRYFGIVPGRGLIVTGAGDEKAGGTGTIPWLDQAEIKKAGAKWILPWQDQKTEAAVEEQLLKQVRNQLKEQGITGALKAQVMEEAIKKELKGVLNRDRPLQHELGHMWFSAAFSEQKNLGDRAGAGHYWLDETSGVLLEDDKLTADRRRQFAEAFKANPNRIRPLKEFFTMEYPAGAFVVTTNVVEDSNTNAGDMHIGVGVSVKVADADRETSDDAGAADVYLQCRGFIDFLIERTKDEQVFRRIAEVEAKGGDMAGWLAANSTKLGLPDTVEGLDKLFRAWSRQYHSP